MVISLITRQSVRVLWRLKVGLGLNCISNSTTSPRQIHNKMRLIQFTWMDENQRLGIDLQNGGDVVDLSASGELLATDMVQFIKGGQRNLDLAKEILASGQHVVKRDQVHLLSPITNTEKVLCIGMNYIDHCTEQNVPVPTEPIIFNKFSSCIVGPTDNVVYPDLTEQLDWEVELTIVIGKSCKNVKESEALDCVFGYTVAHDVSARDWQMNKNIYIWLSNKKLFLYARFMTLSPGDLILTGTPPGVGVFKKPQPIFLKRGDVVECEIDEIGTITNKIV
ncbi:fumarylacetoacetate hydrolase domain-containing protein 2-like [Anneissia japonica]|uniref:fumarylacetoacetate hydrolase domain-containing protein 2-like n=1 Tax=Anneissia japonica TaxID=1529436 RepID=UPI00142584A4|nr:fumarylacetoacetate hydrolase domain-containing protein 2-like [Anneissia japonica]